MDPRLLHHYNLELQHLREMGAEFARQFPKVASRLGMSGLEVADPYVERLLEGVGFMAARVQLKLDAEFPRFTQALLEMVYPHYLAPTPSMLVAQMKPDGKDPNLASGLHKVARGSTMHGLLAGDDITACEFRTAHDVPLWPIEVVSASYFSFAPDLPIHALPVAQRVRGGLRIRLKTTGKLKFRQLALDRLSLYLSGRDDVANTLYELSQAAGLGVLAGTGTGVPAAYECLPPSSIRPIGFEDAEALLPVTLRSFQGYRLLQEYFSFPQRFRFVELTGLNRVVRKADSETLELVLLFGRGDGTLESVVDASNVSLFCTPAVNLLHKRADRVHVSDGSHEFHVVPDRTRPLDFEVYQVTRVSGHGAGSDGEQEFLPLYAAYSADPREPQSAYFTTRREPRLTSSTEKRRGQRSSYVGTEVFLSLVDPQQAPFSGDLRQLSIETLCTNRDLVLQMPLSIGKSDFSLDVAAPVESIRVISGPSRPHAPAVDGAIAWRAISHLSLNYLSLVNASSQEGASALRDLLGLYSHGQDASARKQVEGIRDVHVGRVVRRLPMMADGDGGAGRRLAFGRGIEVKLVVDELAFEGGSAYLLGAVLEQFFRRYVSINSFCETVLRSPSRGEIHRWVPSWGARQTL